MAKTHSAGRGTWGAGASSIGFGAGTFRTAPATDKEVVQAIVAFLENRRAIYDADYLEASHQVDQAAIEMARALALSVQMLGPTTSTIATSLKILHAACRRYLDGPRPQFPYMGYHREIRGQGDPGFFVALGELRAILGVELKRLDKACKLKIDPLLRELFPAPYQN